MPWSRGRTIGAKPCFPTLVLYIHLPFPPCPLCASPSFDCLNNLRVQCSLSLNSPKFVELEHSYKSFKNLSWNPVLSQFNPVHIFITLFLTSALVLPIHLWPGLSSSWYFAVTFSWTLFARARVRAWAHVTPCVLLIPQSHLSLLHCPNIYFPRLDSPSVRRPTHCWGSDITFSNTHTSQSVGLSTKSTNQMQQILKFMTSNKLENVLHLVGWFSWKYDDARTCKP